MTTDLRKPVAVALGLDRGIVLEGQVDEAALVGIHRAQALGLAELLDLLRHQEGDLRQLLLAAPPEIAAVQEDRAGGSYLGGDAAQDHLERVESLAPPGQEKIPVPSVQVDPDRLGILRDPEFDLERGGGWRTLSGIPEFSTESVAWAVAVTGPPVSFATPSSGAGLPSSSPDRIRIADAAAPHAEKAAPSFLHHLVVQLLAGNPQRLAGPGEGLLQILSLEFHLFAHLRTVRSAPGRRLLPRRLAGHLRVDQVLLPDGEDVVDEPV